MLENVRKNIFHIFIQKNFNTEENFKIYSEYLYIYHLDSISNILAKVLYDIFIHLSFLLLIYLNF